MNIFHELYLIARKIFNSWILPYLPGTSQRSITWKRPVKVDTTSPEEVRAIQETWKLVAQDPKGNSVKLFLHFFKEFPQYQNKFRGFGKIKYEDLAKNARFQAHALTVVNSIGGLIDNIGEPLLLKELLNGIGHSHKGRGLNMDDFQNLFQSVLGFFSIALKTIWTPKAQSGWEKVFCILSIHIEDGLLNKA